MKYNFCIYFHKFLTCIVYLSVLYMYAFDAALYYTIFPDVLLFSFVLG